MKRTAFAAPLSQTGLALMGMALPVLYVMAAGSGSLATAARSSAGLMPSALIDYLLAVAAALVAAG